MTLLDVVVWGALIYLFLILPLTVNHLVKYYDAQQRSKKCDDTSQVP